MPNTACASALPLHCVCRVHILYNKGSIHYLHRHGNKRTLIDASQEPISYLSIWQFLVSNVRICMYIIHGCKYVLQVILPETLKGRAFHASVIIHSSPKIRIICFGGINDWPEDDDTDKAVPIAQTTVVELCKYKYNMTLYTLLV